MADEKIIAVVGATGAQTPALGALPSLYTATAPDVRPNDFYGPDGFQEMRGGPKKVAAIKAAEDDALAGELWRVSERLTGVRYIFK